MGVSIKHRVHMSEFKIFANSVRKRNGGYELFPVKIISIRGIDEKDPNCIPNGYEEAYRRMLGGKNPRLTLNSVSAFFPDGVMLHFAPDASDPDTQDEFIGPWLNRNIDIDIEVEKGGRAKPDRYHIRCYYDEDANDYFLLLHYERNGIQYYMRQIKGDYVEVEEIHP